MFLEHLASYKKAPRSDTINVPEQSAPYIRQCYYISYDLGQVCVSLSFLKIKFVRK